MTTTETQAALEPLRTLDEMPWVDPPSLPPSDLPDSDGEPMESPWHVGSGVLLKESYAAARGPMTDYYVGVNMFVYYSWQQVRNQDFKGPDVYFVHGVDGQKARRYWAIWDEEGRYPDVVLELLSSSTEREDLGNKRRIYEQTFRVKEYFCIAPQVARIIGWRLINDSYVALQTDERGWIWSESLGLWIGAWQGRYLLEENTWPRFYGQDGKLVLLEVEAAQQQLDATQQQLDVTQQQLDVTQQQLDATQQQLDAERERADAAHARIAELEAALRSRQR